ncbi:uncharacterized protein CYBJADRAFT_192036 [Cyberlindnera jadinii NRRL Y-1542]|uniref:Uncharacterized protein n=1 Tax=Cyberlindnera jadinii (strain ATCC 18201 / CBS 1600 / BCRC 20928 / JCM 3617 / NBRC 0987 / NRRL Y-1542) TaxID=983966 RepID=A0A1E4RVG3_CYBJN|nr:hypothetical protein CYBJADRAFT_192036 [Cyberlindnera jadinii NRRL Y-1542]ODV71264.1 hypothetical protein CYBJADRAFT_192036 [Cyberlindnera jadinii NRRL Y-1542]
MDEEQTAAISSVLEQHEENVKVKAEDKKAAENGSKGRDEEGSHKSGPTAVTSRANATSKATINSHKVFSVDPSLKVGIGIVNDIVGPRAGDKSQAQHTQQPPQHQQATTVNESGVGVAQCTRCKKDYAIYNGKVFKLCPHCRELQRLRSRRWQEKTKATSGSCRRCGTAIPQDQSKYVLCPPCRLNLRNTKAQRLEKGKCVHCSGENDSQTFKVCFRCRAKDRERRRQLELNNQCNRCSSKLSNEDMGRKVCLNCRNRNRNKKSSSAEKTTIMTSSQPGFDITNTNTSSLTHANTTSGTADNKTTSLHPQDHDIPTKQQVELVQQLEANMFAQQP